MARTAKKSAKKSASRKVAKRGTARKVAKRATAKRASANRAAPRKAAAPSTPIDTAYKKTQIVAHIAEVTELTKRQVAEVFDELSNLIHRHLRKRGAGEFTVPGLMKCMVKRKPATKARKGVNPFTGEPTTFKAKPARNIVKVRPLKRLKEMAE